MVIFSLRSCFKAMAANLCRALFVVFQWDGKKHWCSTMRFHLLKALCIFSYSVTFMRDLRVFFSFCWCVCIWDTTCMLFFPFFPFSSADAPAYGTLRVCFSFHFLFFLPLMRLHMGHYVYAIILMCPDS